MKKGIISCFLALSLVLACIPIASAASAAISLNGKSISASGNGVSVSNNIATITEGGTYTVSGTVDNGRILVDAKGCDVKLILNEVDMTCNYGSPIYIFKASSAEIFLAEGTENILTDGEVYTYDDNYSSQSEQEPNACLYSKADLVISGNGKLTVNGKHNNGITSKDTLSIRDASLEVTSKGNGINGKDSFFAANAHFTVNAQGGDALRSTKKNDPSLGWITLNNCITNLTAANDGIQAETGIIISGGEHYITAGGGYKSNVPDGESAKGIKAEAALSVDCKSLFIDSYDDSLHAGGNITVTGGKIELKSGDDGIHSDSATAINGGSINIYSLGKGLDSNSGTVQNGGSITVFAPDSSIFDKIGGFTINGGTFAAFSGRNTVLQPAEKSAQSSYAVLFDTAAKEEFNLGYTTVTPDFPVKYILVSKSGLSGTEYIKVGDSSINISISDYFSLYNYYNSVYATDDTTMTLLGIKAGTPSSAAGTALYRNGAPLADSAIVSTGDTAILNQKEYTVVIIGDVSRDGKVNSTDFMQVRRYFLGTYEMTNIQLLAANVNGDKKINSTDFMQIRKHFLGSYDLYA